MNPTATSIPPSRPPWLRWLPPTEAKVLGFVLGTLLVSELAMRSVESRLSLDIKHLQQFEKIVARLDSQEIENTQTVLVVGNSLVREGIRPETFRKTTANQIRSPFAVERLHPDSTAFAEWYYAIDRFVLTEHRSPNAIVLVFQGGHLRDAPSHHVNELGRYYCGPEQLTDLARFDLRTLEQWLQFCLCSLSSSLTNHDRVERRALNSFIPNYRDGIQELNRRSQRQNPNADEVVSYHRLSKLIQLLQSRQIATVLVEIPIQNPTPIDPELEQLAIDKDILLVRATQVSTLTPHDFTDGLHMNATAAERYSQELANAIDWRRIFPTLSLPLPITN